MNKIKELREEHGLSQKDLAKKLHLTNKTISAYEQNYANPKIETLINLANLFACSIDYLVGRESEEGMIIVKNQLSEKEKALLSSFNNLNDINQEMIINFLDLTLYNQNNKS